MSLYYITYEMQKSVYIEADNKEEAMNNVNNCDSYSTKYIIGSMKGEKIR